MEAIRPRKSYRRINERFSRSGVTCHGRKRCFISGSTADGQKGFDRRVSPLYGLSEGGELLLARGGDGDLIGLRVEVSEGAEEVGEERRVNVCDGKLTSREPVGSFNDGLSGGCTEEEGEEESDRDKERDGFGGRHC